MRINNKKKRIHINKKQIKNHLFNDDIKKAIEYVNSIADEQTLSIYTFNYNWDNGFSIPYSILQNKCCTLNIALLLFDLADGFTYLKSKEDDSDLPDWSKFVKELYNRIINKDFIIGKTLYYPQLSKVQLFKLKKYLSKDEFVFITPIDGIDCRIYL
ncbi:MAG: DUF4274 domain-containing protein [Holdemanella sp.]|nr:DUF4274 domain-containing protein [Holdemanella sp.]